MDLLLHIGFTILLASLVCVGCPYREKKKNRIATDFAFGIPQLLLSPFEVTKSQKQ